MGREVEAKHLVRATHFVELDGPVVPLHRLPNALDERRVSHLAALHTVSLTHRRRTTTAALHITLPQTRVGILEIHRYGLR